MSACGTRIVASAVYGGRSCMRQLYRFVLCDVHSEVFYSFVPGIVILLRQRELRSVEVSSSSVRVFVDAWGVLNGGYLGGSPEAGERGLRRDR